MDTKRSPQARLASDQELIAHLDQRAHELIADFEPSQLREAITEDVLVPCLVDELRFFGYLSDEELRFAAKYLDDRHALLMADAQRRLAESEA
jgi:hypothetical protein